MKKRKKAWLAGLLLLGLLLWEGGEKVLPGSKITGKAAGNAACRVGSALKYTAKQLGIILAEKDYQGYRTALEELGILQEGEWLSLKRAISREEAALLASRLMDYLGEQEDTEQVERILRYQRISDIGKAEKKLQRFVARVLGAGILIGASDGAYTQSRRFEPKKTMSEAEVREVIKRAMGKQKRKPMSPDGQLIRTTKLPFNACEYDYILASFPNRFYTVKFGYERADYNHMPVSPKNYASPVQLKNRSSYEMIAEWKYEWAELLRKNYELRLNFDYRTADEAWVQELAATYHSRFDKEEHTAQVERIKEWVAWAKKNKVILESRIISVEPSVFYYDGQISTSAYLEFRVRSCKNYEANQDKVIFGSSCDIAGVRQKEWYGGVFGCEISWYSMTPTGDTAGVPVRSGMWTGWEKDRKKSLLAPKKQSEWSYIFAPVKTE